MGHIFISYSRLDVVIMRRIADTLRNEGLIIWTDESLQPGTTTWKHDVERALENASCLVAIFSPAAKTSEWVQREMDYAESLKLPVFPVLARGDERNAIPFGYASVQRVDIRDERDYAIEMRKLTAGIYRYARPSTITPTNAPNETTNPFNLNAADGPVGSVRIKEETQPTRPDALPDPQRPFVFDDTQDLLGEVKRQFDETEPARPDEQSASGKRPSKQWSRVQVAKRLGDEGDTDSLQLLRIFSHSANPELKAAALEAIERIKARNQANK